MKSAPQLPTAQPDFTLPVPCRLTRAVRRLLRSLLMCANVTIAAERFSGSVGSPTETEPAGATVLGSAGGTALSRTATAIGLPPSTTVGPELAVVAPPPTRIIAQPRSAAIGPGSTAVFTITAAGEDLAFQWKKNGVTLPGVNAPAFAVTDATAADMGFYSVVVAGNGGMIESDAAILTVASAPVSRLVNLSTRGFVPAGGALTSGFAWRGAGRKNLLVRAVGPVLSRFGVDGVLADPRMEIFQAGTATALLVNDDWGLAAPLPGILVTTIASGAFALDAGSRDAATLLVLDPAAPRSHTARITSADPAGAGVVLAELYDTDSASAPGRLSAVSTLGLAGTGERVLVPGFTIAGAAPKRLLIRAIGPGLEQFGVTDVLADPRITVRAGGHGTIAVGSDDWGGAVETSVAADIAGAFALAAGSQDAALVVSLPPGSYTITVSGAGDATGAVLVEIYDLDP